MDGQHRPRAKRAKTELTTPAPPAQQYLPSKCFIEVAADHQAVYRYRGRTLTIWQIEAGKLNLALGTAKNIRSAEVVGRKHCIVCEVSFQVPVPVGAELRVMYCRLRGPVEIANAAA